MSKNIVILGGGYAGILIAKKLAKKLGKITEIHISLIDKNPYHTMLTELHEVAAGRVSHDSIRISLKKIFAGRNVTVIQDIITTVDYENQLLKGNLQEYNYDYLVMASGSQPAFFGMDSIREHCFPLWSYNDAVILRDHIESMFRKASETTDIQLRESLLSFYISGAGLTGVEMAGELAEYSVDLCKLFEIDQSCVKIVIIDLLKKPVNTLPDKISDKVARRLEKMGVTLLLGTKVTGAGEGYVETVDAAGENQPPVRHKTHTLIWTAGIEGSDIIKSSEPLKLNRGFRAETDSYLRSVNYNNVYIAGDNMYYIPEGGDKPVPQMVENCENCAGIIANNIASAITGGENPELKPYKPNFHGTMISIGSRYGAAYVGTEKKKYALPSFLAMFVKHLINIVYFIQVAGFNKVSSYLKHEFFTIRNRRSFVGGHFSNVTPSFMLVPLRLYLGFYWLYEGYKKIMEHWLTTPMLTSFFSGANSFYESLLNPGEAVSMATGTSEAVSMATGYAPAVYESTQAVLINFNFLGLFRVILVNPGELALKIQVPLADMFIDNFILPYDNIQMLFQIVIVLSEILIGLALIAGLLNFLASAYSLVLQALFVSSTGLYMATWWIVFAAIAVLFRGGSVLGLDYWVMPALKKWWKKIKTVRKCYLYYD